LHTTDEHDSVILTLREAAWLLAFAGAALVLLALTFGLRMSRPAQTTIDGVKRAIPYGTTIGKLESEGAVFGRPGRLLAVDGSVLATEGGAPVLLTRNGRPAAMTQLVLDGDVIQSTSGSDTVETTVTLREPMPVQTRMTGSGPVMRLGTPGSVGVRERVAGSVSDKTVSERIIVTPQDMVIVRTRPDPRQKLIALTFDDGPWPGQTDKIVSILEKKGVHATFFMVGVRVKAHPELAAKVEAAGNLVGSHTLGHRDLTKSSPKEIERQIVGGAREIQKATGVSPIWFRPPYGAINAKVWKQVRTSKMRVALWTVDTRDWTRPGDKTVLRRATRGVRKGAIILMHDGGVNRRQTIRTLPRIIDIFKKRGYVFVTLQELYDAK
jgi:peptidoglycan/xylan/chitin deacetylase (PgdA/CDA1 family)